MLSEYRSMSSGHRVLTTVDKDIELPSLGVLLLKQRHLGVLRMLGATERQASGAVWVLAVQFQPPPGRCLKLISSHNARFCYAQDRIIIITNASLQVLWGKRMNSQ